MRRIALLLASTLVLVSAATFALTRDVADASAAAPVDVMFVGNNWDGTADIVNAKTFQKIRKLNLIPDKAARMAEIKSDPVTLGYYLGIRQLIGEGHDQFTDDMFSTHDGRLLAVSRPSFADVVGIDISSGKIIWRFKMDGERADHMGASPDGTRLLVSDSTANKVHELDLHTGRKLREFASGDTPHENNYTKKGERIFHASIGRVFVPADESGLGENGKIVKGKSVFQIVDARSFRILKRWDIGQKLDEAGYPGMSSAVRPMAVAPDERFVYLQVSYFHGFVEFDTRGAGKVTRLAHLPMSDKAKKLSRSQYVLNSAHHGLAINPAGTKLCAAGTMSDYAAIVSRKTFAYKILPVGDKPYWSTNGYRGKTCWVSVAGTDKVVVIDYAKEKIIKRIAVGDHPQRVREGKVAQRIVTSWRR